MKMGDFMDSTTTLINGQNSDPDLRADHDPPPFRRPRQTRPSQAIPPPQLRSSGLFEEAWGGQYPSELFDCPKKG